MSDNPGGEYNRRKVLRNIGISATTIGIGSATASGQSSRDDRVMVPAGFEVPAERVRKGPKPKKIPEVARLKRKASRHDPDPVDGPGASEGNGNGSATTTTSNSSTDSATPGSEQGDWKVWTKDHYYNGTYHEMQAEWTVPSPPPADENSDDTVGFYFPALVNCVNCIGVTTCIIQPVLEWNHSDDPTSYDWYLRSWAVCGGGDNADVSRSSPIGANVNDTIFGVMQYQPSDDTWNIHSYNQTEGTVTSLVTSDRFGSQNMDNSYCALEIGYGEGDCDEFPGSTTFDNIYLEGKDGNYESPEWNKHKNNNCGYQSTVWSDSQVHITTWD